MSLDPTLARAHAARPVRPAADFVPHRTPVVSVIIPTYRRASRIEAVLRAVLAQTYQNFEIIVVDDASGDGTWDVVTGLGDPRIQFIGLQENSGANVARMTGVHAAEGEFIAFLDSDDIWMPSKLEKQLSLLKQKGPEYTFCTTWFELQNAKGEIRMRIEPELDGIRLHELCIANWLGGYSMLLVRKQALLDIGGPDPSLPACQDWDLYLRLNDTGAVCVVPEHLVAYVQDVDDPVRISTKRESVIAGHRHIFALMRQRQGQLSGAELGRAYRQFLEFFAGAGASKDVARVLVQTPPRVWLQKETATHATRMLVRTVRRRLTLGDRTIE